MDEQPTYVKLSELVDATFTPEKVWGYQYQVWNNTEKSMKRFQQWNEAKQYCVDNGIATGPRKTYGLETDKGKLTLSANQLASCLEAVVKDGVANLVGRTIQVKSNGQSGKDIRYFFNAMPEEQQEETPTDDEVDNQNIFDNVPF